MRSDMWNPLKAWKQRGWGSGKKGKVKPSPIYCRSCGTKLSEKRDLLYYDDQTGVAVYAVGFSKVCPNRFCG